MEVGFCRLLARKMRCAHEPIYLFFLRPLLFFAANIARERPGQNPVVHTFSFRQEKFNNNIYVQSMFCTFSSWMFLHPLFTVVVVYKKNWKVQHKNKSEGLNLNHLISFDPLPHNAALKIQWNLVSSKCKGPGFFIRIKRSTYRKVRLCSDIFVAVCRSLRSDQRSMSYSALYFRLGSIDIFQIYTTASHKYSVADVFDGF